MDFTPRETQVLGLLARGLRNKEIATELGITTKSVMHHTVSIYRRLGVRSRTEAVTVAAQRGVITLRDVAVGPPLAVSNAGAA